MKKIFILLALSLAVSTHATDEWQFDYETGGGNFTKKQRWATFGLNIVPGVGSYVIMDDLTGALIQLGLGGGGLASIALSMSVVEDHSPGPLFFTGVGLVISSYLYNIYRSITYDKPKKTAFGEHEGFNVAVLPDRNGKLNAFLMFNKAF